MLEQVEAIYESGMLRPPGQVNLDEAEKVLLSISKPTENPSTDMLDHQFIEYERSEVAKMGEVPSIKEVRKHLSKIEGSMAECIIAERGEY